MRLDVEVEFEKEHEKGRVDLAYHLLQRVDGVASPLWNAVRRSVGKD